MINCMILTVRFRLNQILDWPQNGIKMFDTDYFKPGDEAKLWVTFNKLVSIQPVTLFIVNLLLIYTDNVLYTENNL